MYADRAASIERGGHAADEIEIGDAIDLLVINGGGAIAEGIGAAGAFARDGQT